MKAGTVLITGGAGYIGSHFAALLQRERVEYVVLDNLSRGTRRLVAPERLVVGDIRDCDLVSQLCSERDVDVVVHFAGYIAVGESVREPSLYYDNNVVASYAFLEALRAAGVANVVFSSSAATYGQPVSDLIGEDDPQLPINPYGETKLIFEHMLRDYDHAYGMRSFSLRYFNASGASRDEQLFECHEPETHLIPLAIDAAVGSGSLTIFGTDYPTPDGTCIRDYIHVDDLASAHLAAVAALRDGRPSQCLNLGVGHGYSVREVIESVTAVCGTQVRATEGPRRPGDPPVLVADSRRAREVLAWTPKYTSLAPIVETAYEGYRRFHEFRKATATRPE